MNLNDIIEEAIDDELSAQNAGNDVAMTALAAFIEQKIVAASGGPDHIVRSDHVHGVLTMQHPIAERFDGTLLFDCDIFEHIRKARAVFGDGSFRVWVKDGILRYEKVPS